MQGTITVTAATPAGVDLQLSINEYGRLMTEGATMCSEEATGPEFNPLYEVDAYGRPNPYQDPTRGRFEACTTEDESGECELSQKFLL